MYLAVSIISVIFIFILTLVIFIFVFLNLFARAVISTSAATHGSRSNHLPDTTSYHDLGMDNTP